MGYQVFLAPPESLACQRRAPQVSPGFLAPEGWEDHQVSLVGKEKEETRVSLVQLE